MPSEFLSATPERRRRRCSVSLWLICTALLAGVARPAAAAEFDLQTATIADIQAAMESGALSSERLVELYLNRIEAYDKRGPRVNAMITVNPRALDEARALDAERRENGPRSPLHGIPVVFKDLIDVEALPTTAGFSPFGAPVPMRDATIVARLRDAGAVMLGKASTTNWFGNGFDDTHPIGASLNPYNLAHTPGGSSNGSGVAMAAYFATLAIGTDTSVSVQSPAANNSVVGMVGTYGMVSRAGIVPRGATQDRPGPMGRSVADVATMFSVISGWDAEDLTTFEAIGRFPEGDWSRQLGRPELAGRRIGILREMIPDGPEYELGVELFEQAVADLESAGAYVVTVSSGVDSLSVETAQAKLRTAEYEKLHYQNAYLARLGPAAKYKSIQEMIESVGPEKFSDAMIAALTLPPPDVSKDYQSRYRARQTYIDLLVATMDRFGLDAIVQPFTAEPPARLDAPRRQRRADDSFGRNNLSSSLGLPAVVVPGGYTARDNLPIGIQFIGRPFDDLLVLQIANAYEHNSRRRRTPDSTPPLPGERFEY